MAIQTAQAVINGQTYNLTYNSETQLYEAEITAPQKSSYNNNIGHYYPITIKVTDTAGNTTTVTDTDATLGDDLKLYVEETTPPVISIISPTDGQTTTNNKPTVTWQVTDNDSGVNPDTIGITINNGGKIAEGITKTAITGGYKCTYAITFSLPDGTNTIKCDASDFDGNEAVQRSVSFVVDTAPPSLSVTSPANNLITNNKTLAVTGTATDATSSPVSVTVKLNNGSAQSATVGTNGAFSLNVTLAEETNTIVVTATDSAGKTSSVTRTVTLDTKSPVISQVTIPETVNVGQTFKISVKVTD